MILIIRISGMVKIPKIIGETLHRIRLRKKYVAILLEDNNSNRKLLKKIRNYVAYGIVNKEMLEKLISIRGKINGNNKIDVKKIIIELEGKKLEDFGLKPFFRLHSPRGGVESKKHFGVGKGVLGDNKDKINDLLARML